MPAVPPQGLSHFPYWRQTAGVWSGENTYFDGDLNYNIRSYNRLAIITVNGRDYTETEHKFYAPGALAQRFAAGAIAADRGIEVIARFTGHMTDDRGTVEIEDSGQPLAMPGLRPYVSVLSADSAMRVTPGPNAVDAYRMLITLPTPDRRYCVNLGLVYAPGSTAAVGDLRGFAVFRENRIQASDFERMRQIFRARNAVAAVRDTDAAGKSLISTIGTG